MHQEKVCLLHILPTTKQQLLYSGWKKLSPYTVLVARVLTSCHAWLIHTVHTYQPIPLINVSVQSFKRFDSV